MLKNLEKQAKQGPFSGFVHFFIQLIFCKHLVRTRNILGPVDTVEIRPSRGIMPLKSREMKGLGKEDN